MAASSSARPSVWGDTPRHVLNIDWDGCAVPAAWPDRPDNFHPGFVEAMHRFNKAGHPIRIWTARINPRDPWTGERRPDDVVEEEVQYIRDMLDSHGLQFIEIYRDEGKPGGAVYIDDKAERYNAGPRSWARLADKILLRLDGEEPVFPHIPTQEVAS